MDAKFLSPYKPEETEPRIYKLWLDSGVFNPDVCIEKGYTKPDAEPYSIIMPPPNVTGVLHMGHALMITIEDILIRFARMRGKRTLWLPGTDHAAIATQAKVEKDIYKKEKKSRHDLGREELLRRIEQFAKESHDTIVEQIKVVGASCDWSREAFTLDETRTKAVRAMFKKMYDDGLIYRGRRIVNWDPKLQTTVSDDEIEYVEQKDPFYYFKYGPFEIGTVRPETKFGDKYVVMHPNDKRYSKYKHGDTFELEWINGPITATIIKDEAADMEFGSGVMTITPSHSAVDFDIAKRHGLDIEQVIDERGVLLPIAGEFAGQHIKKARPSIIEKLQKKGLITKTDEQYVHNVATNSRGGGIIEPQIKLQWFVDVNKKFILPYSTINGITSGSETTLKEIMRRVVESGATKIIPNYFEKTYFHWIDNLRDWCISRQIWYGHRIPVWYCDCGNIMISADAGQDCKKCAENKDVTFGEPDKNAELRNSIIAYVENVAGDKVLTINWGKDLGGKLLVGGGRTGNEDPLNCALREITEETGYTDVEFLERLPQKITHNYFAASKNVWRTIEVTALKFRLKSEKRVEPSLEEDEESKFTVLWQTKEELSLDIADKAHGYVFRKFAGLKPRITQDPDTLDTWFSSGLWTFSTLGWPEKTKDLELYHPTAVLETGHEILFFWVARMILMTGYALGTPPFHTVYLHGTVRDAQGRKMSKSLGNGIDPIDIAKKFGADAGRMALIIGNTPGTDTRISEDKVKAYKHFANKLWNIARFVLTAVEGVDFGKSSVLNEKDCVTLDELKGIAKDITADIEQYRFYIAGEKIYHYVWHTFADKILEESKPRLTEGDDADKRSAQLMLFKLLEQSLILLHPFMPFITEEVWQSLPDRKQLLVVTPYEC